MLTKFNIGGIGELPSVDGQSMRTVYYWVCPGLPPRFFVNMKRIQFNPDFDPHTWQTDE